MTASPPVVPAESPARASAAEPAGLTTHSSVVPEQSGTWMSHWQREDPVWITAAKAAASS